LIDRVRAAGRTLASLLALSMLGTATASDQPFPTAARPPALHFDLTAARVKANCSAAIARAKVKVDALVAARAPRTFDTVVFPLEDAFADLNDETVVETLLSQVATGRDVRDASFTCQNDESAFQNEIAARPDLFRAIAAAAAGGTARTIADRKLTQIWLVLLERSGAGLSAADRKQFVALSDKLNAMENQFGENLGNEKTTITLTAAQIAGLPEDFVATFAKTDAGGYVVPVGESTVQPFAQNTSDATARKTYYFAYLNRGYPANEKLLQDAIAIRDQLAQLMGYKTWAAYVLADRMAQTPQRVDSFLTALDVKLLPRAQVDEMLNKTRYAVDDHAIAQYFPVEHVERAVFDIYSKLLGITFAKRDVANVWYSDVTEWTVTDTATGRYIGDFYLDLFPRDGKFSHFAQFPLLPTRRLADGRVRAPVSAIIGNWPRPAPGHPAILSHDDVQTFFHEFGHNMAALLATAPYETLSQGFRQDFIEAPSQMLENWVWDPAILKQLSSNVTTGEPLPDDLIAHMRAARYVDNAFFTTRQIALAAVDMKYHTSGPHIDTAGTYAEVFKDDTPLPVPPGIHPEASFTHLMGGYDAGYYGYLWSKVYAQDMFTAFASGGLESPVVGARYRQDILQPAREIEPDAEVNAFLGRPMDPSAFYKEFDEEGNPAPAPAPSPS
jgi:thimet oligopeptidase